MDKFEETAWACGRQFLVNRPHEFEQMWIVRTAEGSYGEGETLFDALEAAVEDQKNREIAEGTYTSPEQMQAATEELRKIIKDD